VREITLYRLPIVRAAGRRSRLRHVVHEALLHELGHLFGMTERDLDEYTIVAKHCADAAELAGPRSRWRSARQSQTSSATPTATVAAGRSNSKRTG
jgi:hypothetical protein